MKLVYQSIHPIAFNAVRFLIASTAMTLLLKLKGVNMRIEREDVRGVVWLGFITNTVYQFLFVLGLDRTKAGNAGLLMSLAPIFAYVIVMSDGPPIGVIANHVIMLLMPEPMRLREGSDIRRLRFQDALEDCIALSELAMDMVEAFASRKELIRIQNGFKPLREPRRERSRRRSSRS